VVAARRDANRQRQANFHVLHVGTSLMAPYCEIWMEPVPAGSVASCWKRQSVSVGNGVEGHEPKSDRRAATWPVSGSSDRALRGSGWVLSTPESIVAFWGLKISLALSTTCGGQKSQNVTVHLFCISRIFERTPWRPRRTLGHRSDSRRLESSQMICDQVAGES
jgi:hypothetical protein